MQYVPICRVSSRVRTFDLLDREFLSVMHPLFAPAIVLRFNQRAGKETNAINVPCVDERRYAGNRVQSLEVEEGIDMEADFRADVIPRDHSESLGSGPIREDANVEDIDHPRYRDAERGAGT